VEFASAEGKMARASFRSVETEAKLRLRDPAQGRGYVLASVHHIEPDVPGASVWAMAQAEKQWGKYPLRMQES